MMIVWMTPAALKLRRLYTRDLLSACTDAEEVASSRPSQCCISGDAGQVRVREGNVIHTSFS